MRISKKIDVQDDKKIKLDEKAEMHGDEPPLSNGRKLLNFIKSLRIEPFVLLFFAGFSFRMAVTSQLLLDKTCSVYFNYSKSFCDNMLRENDTEAVDTIQKVANNYGIILSLVATIPTIASGIFLGPFSDKYGRKIPMIGAVLNPLIDAIQFLIFVAVWNMPINLLIIIQSPTGFLGGVSIVMSCAYSYISEMAHPKDRPFRFAVLQIFFLTGMTGSQLAAGALVKIVGYVTIFVASLVCCALSILWLLIVFKEPKDSRGVNKENISIGKMVKDLFSLDSVKESVKACTKKREGNRRTQVWLLVVSMCAIYLPLMGITGITYYYVRKRFAWDIDHYTYVETGSRVLDATVVVLLAPLLTRVFRLSDPVISVLGSISIITSNICAGISTEEWMYYIAMALRCFTGLGPVGVKNRLSKIIPREELGKVFMMVGIIESMVPLVGTSLFGSLYTLYIGTNPGVPLIIAGAIPTIAIVCLSWMYIWGTSCEEQTKPNLKPDDHEVSVYTLEPKGTINDGFDDIRL